MNKMMSSLISVGMIAAIVTGCGVPVAHPTTEQAAQKSASPVHVLGLSQRTHLALTPTQYESLSLSSATGTKVVASVRQQPLIFFSPSMGGKILLQKLAEVHVSPTPLLISTGFPPHVTQKQAVSETQKLLAQTHVNWPIAYDFGDPFGTLTSGLPDTYIWRNRHVWEIPGLLPHVAQWQKALTE